MARPPAPAPARRLPGRRRPASLAAALAVGLAAAGCSGGPSGADTVAVGDGRVPTARLEAAAGGLCRAVEEAAEADTDAARLTFYADSHESLHTIARALEDVDRGAAAELLVAKQAVEADFTGGAPAPQLRADLATLAEVTRAGLARLDVSVPACD